MCLIPVVDVIVQLQETLLTFQHLDSDRYSVLGFVLVDAQGLGHHNLTEATLT